MTGRKLFQLQLETLESPARCSCCTSLLHVNRHPAPAWAMPSPKVLHSASFFRAV